MIVRTAAWTGFTALIWSNSLLDLVEMVSLGSEWQFGYAKHPPLTAWLAALFTACSPGTVWAAYLAGYLCTALAIWAAWRLALEMLTPRRALLAALSLEGILLLSLDAADFNNNVTLNACWAIAILCFYRACSSKHGKQTRWWLATGLAVGLGMLCKYTMALLVCSMLLFLIWDARARVSWRRPGLYLGGLVALIVFAPHAWWLTQHNFPTLNYASASLQNRSGFVNHFLSPANFALGILVILVPLGFMLQPVLGRPANSRSPAQTWNRRFLAAMVLGPLALHLLLGLLGGFKLNIAWSMPLFTFMGLLLLVAAGGDSGSALLPAWRRWSLVVLATWGWALFHTFFGPSFTGRAGRVHFPGRDLASEVTRLWGEHCREALPIVAGEPWFAYNVACYARNRPSAYPNLDHVVAPWSSDADLCRRGGVLLWNAAEVGDDLPASLRPRFPAAQVLPPLVLPYHCLAHVKPVRVGIAVQLPARHQSLSTRHSRSNLIP